MIYKHSHNSFRDFCIGLALSSVGFKVIRDFWLILLEIKFNFKEFDFRLWKIFGIKLKLFYLAILKDICVK